MKRLTVFLILAAMLIVTTGCRWRGLRGGPCSIQGRPILAPWARQWTPAQPAPAVVAQPDSCGCGVPLQSSGYGPAMVPPGTTYEPGVIYQEVPGSFPTQPIPEGVVGPEGATYP